MKISEGLAMLSKIFKITKLKTYKRGDFFAITKGKYGGEVWFLSNKNEKDYDVLS